MESSSNKGEAMKLVMFKAGIPLVVSVAGFAIAKIATRKSSVPTASSQNEVNNVEEILRLRRIIEEMRGRELQLEKRFLTYQGLKDREMVLMELQRKMMVEINKVEFLEGEVSLVEEENRRFESVVKEYLEVLRLEEVHRSENEQLRGKVRKLLRKSKEHCRILRKQCLQIRCKDLEISRNRKEIEELKLMIEQLQGEKTAAAAKGEGEKVTAEEYNMLLQELDLLQNHKALESDVEGGEKQGESYFGLRNRDHTDDHSKRRRLMAKLKRWVEGKGSSFDEKERHGSKCFPRHDGAQHAYVPARKSCSSV